MRLEVPRAQPQLLPLVRPNVLAPRVGAPQVGARGGVRVAMAEAQSEPSPRVDAISVRDLRILVQQGCRLERMGERASSRLEPDEPALVKVGDLVSLAPRLRLGLR